MAVLGAEAPKEVTEVSDLIGLVSSYEETPRACPASLSLCARKEEDS